MAQVLTNIKDRLPTRKRVTASWTTNDGTAYVTVSVGAAGEAWDLVSVAADLSASVSAATYTVHLGEGSSFTAGSRADRYTSDATAVADAVVDRLVAPQPFQLDSSGNLYLLIVPDTGTTSGDIDLDFDSHEEA